MKTASNVPGLEGSGRFGSVEEVVKAYFPSLYREQLMAQPDGTRKLARIAADEIIEKLRSQLTTSGRE